jgi:DNA-binding PadR family transcriptional regulator
MKPDVIRQKFGIKGFLNFWIISILSKKSASGYQIMQNIEDCTNGVWKPTSGAIYPALDKLKEMRWIEGKKKGSRNQIIYSLTPKGRELFNEMKQKFIEHSKSFKFRNIIDSLIWENEPKELRENIEKLFVAILNFRTLMNGKYKKENVNKAIKLMEKITKEIESFKTY